MPSDLLASVQWTDMHLGYDREYDCYSQRRNITRQDGTVLYDVSELKHGAQYTVHFCPGAKEIWAISVDGLRDLIWFGSDWRVAYSPSKVSRGQVTARGYLVSCERVKEFGHCFNMPENLAVRFQAVRTKSEAGLVAEKAFEWLVNDRHFFPSILTAPARRSSQQDDICGGVDFWCADDLPVQVKFDGPGGSSESGRLFFQTHTLPLRQCEDWNGFDYE